MKLTNAIILAAGLGKRMRPLTYSIPKPLLSVRGVPLIDRCLDWLVAADIGAVVINSSYRAQQIEDYLAPRHRPSIRFSREEPLPLETGGGIARALPMLGTAPFLAMNSDAIFPPQSVHPVMRMQAEWREDLDFLMLLVPMKNAVGWSGRGDFVCDVQGRIRRPRDGEAAPYLFSGVEIIHPRAFVGCPGSAFPLSELWDERIGDDGWYSNIRAVIHDGDWLNVGDLAGLAAAENYSAVLSSGSWI